MSLRYFYLFFALLAALSSEAKVIYQASVPAYVNYFAVKGVTKKGKVFFLMPLHGSFLEDSHAMRQTKDFIDKNENDGDPEPLWMRQRGFEFGQRVWESFYEARNDKKWPPVSLRFFIVDEKGNFMGEAGVSPASGSKEKSTIYYNIVKEYRRLGLATAAAGKLVQMFKSYWPGQVLHIHFTEKNVVSQKIAKSIGFRPSLLSDGSPEYKTAFGKKFIYYKMSF